MNIYQDQSQNSGASQLLHATDVEICTDSKRWVIPYNCVILKALLAEKNIQAHDLRFASDWQCHEFIRRMFLLAAEDECQHKLPSELASLARELIGINTSLISKK